LIILIALILMLVTSAVPQAIGQRWSWRKPPEVAQLRELRTLRKQGIAIGNWQTAEGKEIQLGDRNWYWQTLKQKKTTAAVLFMPQTDSKQQPQVEWTDIQGIQRWQSDSEQTLKIQAEALKQPFETRFFRALTPDRTFAVVQWYAQSNGGSPSPAQWYFNDRQAQWQRQRIPWVAVNVQLPMEPRDDLKKYEAQATQLAAAVQLSLTEKVFQPPAAGPP
jgi:cyanoexosortase B-associated protein